MNKAALLSLFIALLASVTLASCPFSVRFNVTWDPIALGWNVNGADKPELEVAAGYVGIFNISSAPFDFFISSKDCSEGNRYALTRKQGVTNNVCTPPCTVAFNLTSDYFFYCASPAAVSTTGTLHPMDCPKLGQYRCGKVIGCGWSESDSKCYACYNATTKKDCEKLENCSWCPGDDVCLHENSNACRGQIEYERSVPSWVWLLITLCALVVLVAVLLTLFITEHGFKKRWAALSKTDKDFAEVGKGANDGLFATD